MRLQTPLAKCQFLAFTLFYYRKVTEKFFCYKELKKTTDENAVDTIYSYLQSLGWSCKSHVGAHTSNSANIVRHLVAPLKGFYSTPGCYWFKPGCPTSKPPRATYPRCNISGDCARHTTWTLPTTTTTQHGHSPSHCCTTWVLFLLLHMQPQTHPQLPELLHSPAPRAKAGSGRQRREGEHGVSHHYCSQSDGVSTSWVRSQVLHIKPSWAAWDPWAACWIALAWRITLTKL